MLPEIQLVKMAFQKYTIDTGFKVKSDIKLSFHCLKVPVEDQLWLVIR